MKIGNAVTKSFRLRKEKGKKNKAASSRPIQKLKPNRKNKQTKTNIGNGINKVSQNKTKPNPTQQSDKKRKKPESTQINRLVLYSISNTNQISECLIKF